jgi:hypothetical protein
VSLGGAREESLAVNLDFLVSPARSWRANSRSFNGGSVLATTSLP